MRMLAGMALMKPTSFWLEFTLTPQCHWGNQPGGRRALGQKQSTETLRIDITWLLPFKYKKKRQQNILIKFFITHLSFFKPNILTRAEIQESNQNETCCHHPPRSSRSGECTALSASERQREKLNWKHLQDRVVSRCISIRYRGRNLVVQMSYHSRISQIESVPAEALWEAVRLLSYVIFIRLNAAMWCHSLSYKQTNSEWTVPQVMSLKKTCVVQMMFTLLKRKKLVSDQGISTKTKLLWVQLHKWSIPSFGTGWVSQNW